MAGDIEYGGRDVEEGGTRRWLESNSVQKAANNRVEREGVISTYGCQEISIPAYCVHISSLQRCVYCRKASR